MTLTSGQKITFLDTPGHDAFTAMRARGAKVTDIVVLVVAADDGVMPQTKEAIGHAKAAGCRSSSPSTSGPAGRRSEQRARELLQDKILVEEWGGEYNRSRSRRPSTSVDKLEVAILLQAEVLELKANPDRAADGVVIEAQLDRGPWLGRDRAGPARHAEGRRHARRRRRWGRVRRLVDDRGNVVRESRPATPVEILGLDGTPQAGDSSTS